MNFSNMLIKNYNREIIKILSQKFGRQSEKVLADLAVFNLNRHIVIYYLIENPNFVHWIFRNSVKNLANLVRQKILQHREKQAEILTSLSITLLEYLQIWNTFGLDINYLLFQLQNSNLFYSPLLQLILFKSINSDILDSQPLLNSIWAKSLR